MSEENDGLHLQEIMKNTECKKHDAPLNRPCWEFPFAICNSRALEAHFTGVISIESIEPKPHGSRFVKSKQSQKLGFFELNINTKENT